MSRTSSMMLALCALPRFALAQASGEPQYPPPAPAPQQPAQGQPASPPPAPPPPQQQPTTGNAAPGSAAGGGSQQVVVNPPPAMQSPPPSQPGAAATVNPPPSPGYGQSGPPVVIQRESDRRSSLEIVAIDAAYGALAGLLVGGGVALIAENDDWGRDLMIGTGAGILVGTAVGGIHAYNASNDRPRNRYAGDGLGTTDKYPPLAGARTLVGYAAKF